MLAMYSNLLRAASAYRLIEQYVGRILIPYTLLIALTVILSVMTISYARADTFITDALVSTGTISLSLSPNVAVYYIVEESPGLGGQELFSARILTLGFGLPSVSFRVDTNRAISFFRPNPIIVYAPRDTDGDFIDDVYELSHGLDPLNPADANVILGTNDLTNLQIYRQLYGIGSQPAEYFSHEITAFNFGGPSAAIEAISKEITAFNIGAPVFSVEAESRELSIWNGEGGPAQAGMPQVESRELTLYNGEVPLFSLEATSHELSIWNGEGGPAQGGIPEVYSRELSVYNYPLPSATIEAISREVSLFNDIP